MVPEQPAGTAGQIDTLVNAFQGGHLSRRQFVARLLALGVSLSAVGAILAACGGSASAPTSTVAPQTAQATSAPAGSSPSSTTTPARASSPPGAGTPAIGSATTATQGTGARGGKMTVSMSQSPSSLDPAFGINGPEYSITSWIYDNLVQMGPDLQLKPMVATDWKANEDASVWTFKLRNDVFFTNGRQLVADDVVFSIMRILNKDTGSPGRTGLGPIQTVEAPDAQTAVIKLASPYADFPLELTQRWGRIVPKEAAADLKTKPVGSGPYMLAEYVPGAQVRVVRNEKHWDKNAGLVDEITLRTFPDEVAELTALRNGDTQIMFDVPSSSYDQAKKIDGVAITEVASGTWVPLIMRVDAKPFDNPKVREAIKYCMDRPQFVSTVLLGKGTVANDNNVPPSHPFVWKGELRKQDIAKAKALLAEAGMPNGFAFDLVAAKDRSVRADTAVTIQQMVKAAGITFNVKTIDYDTYIAQVYKKGPLYIGYWAMRPTLDSQITPFFSTGGSFNEYAYSNPKLDDTLTKARAELDTEKRKALYQQAQQTLTEEGPVVIPYFLNSTSAYRNQVVGFRAHPLGYFDLRYVSLKK